MTLGYPIVRVSHDRPVARAVRRRKALPCA